MSLEITPEIRQAIAEEACAHEGHDFEVLSTMSGPHLLYCIRCGMAWNIEEAR